ncbi:Lon protease homolog 2, peroxisomal [Sparassis crispa]|uniref:Lon protease homolog n=1 Tax=Sparassis crispa TaxID=139825 RepID=A0A401GY69_9APHY|nr:Lon protease homolog 2, peroxisomal [Sparassis crispa]GBE87130.1 Lon protease homolog 2, peroxisomal [Sparassis crispa]
MSAITLPVFPVPYPFILFPSARLTFPITPEVANSLLQLIQPGDSQPVVVAVPVTAESTLHTWGTTARVIRLVRPQTRAVSDRYGLVLQGISRVRLLEDTRSSDTEGIVERKVGLPAENNMPSAEAVAMFKAASFKLLERLAKDSPQQSKRAAYMKVSNVIEDIADERVPGMADMLVAGFIDDYNDRLDFLSAADADDRLRRATALFVKYTSISEVTRKIEQSVDESLSRQQKEFYLRQQLAAIQRELRTLEQTSIDGRNGGTEEDKRSEPVSELDEDTEEKDMADIRVGIDAMAQGSEERKVAVREWRRLKRIPSGSVEQGVVRNYLDWLVAVPWAASTTTQANASLEALRDRAFLTNARKQLDADHYGLEKIKKRLIEYLAVVRLKELNAEKEARAQTQESQLVVLKANEQDAKRLFPGASPESISPPPRKGVKGPILLFVGPPGTGKTSLGHSIARALNRPFQRISLGGVRDEAEIRGHRRTYVASGPGMIVQALRKAGRPDPVILLDEVDKVGHNSIHGDPSAALLEVLDPEQNHSFKDHYINVPIDLSQVLFICTSNTLETIALPLLDRCEIVQLSGYTYDEKMHIALTFLLPKQLQANGLTPEHVTITTLALQRMATHYTREAGVRSLERAIGAVVRYKAVEWAEYADSVGHEAAVISQIQSQKGGQAEYRSVVEEDELERILGIARWDEEERDREERCGVVYGLVVTGTGEGGILPVETIAVPGTGRLKLTGSLGDVIKESGELALSWVKTHAYDLCITKSRAQDPLKVPNPIDIHLHLPAGAVKKDGPSAGIAMICAFVSLLTGSCIPSNVAMTGEVTLRGRVGPVGGIKEKVLGAHRAQIAKVVLPWANRKDVEHDVPLEVRSDIEFVYVRTIEEVLEAAFGKGRIEWRRSVGLLESRL